jgi:soluble lytic murein transglycosylase-like protein
MALSQGKHAGRKDTKQRWMALGEPCYNARVGAWILAQCFQSHGYTWEAVGCYNARNKIKRATYARKVMKALEENGYAFA